MGHWVLLARQYSVSLPIKKMKYSELKKYLIPETEKHLITEYGGHAICVFIPKNTNKYEWCSNSHRNDKIRAENIRLKYNYVPYKQRVSELCYKYCLSESAINKILSGF